MIKKGTIVLVLTFILISCLVSCTTSDVTSEMNDEKLTIYCSENDGFVKHNVLLFNEKYKDKIEIKTFPTDKRDEYIQAIQEEIAGGGGPDIIIGKRYDAISLSKIINKEGFYDINQLIKKDKNFKITDYHENIMDWGMVNDKRYLIPLKYSIDAFFSTQEIMDENKIAFDSHIVSIDTLKDYINDSIESTEKDNKEIKFLSHFDFLSYIEYTNKRSFGFDENIEIYNQKDFYDVSNEYKKMYEAITPWQDIQRKNYNERSELLKNKEVVFLQRNITAFNDLINPYIAYENEINPKIVFCESVDNKIYSTPEIYAAINSNCLDKAGAYQFIKMLLEIEQQVENTRYYAPGFPVNKKAYTQLNKAFINNTEGIERKGGCTSNDNIEEMVTALEDINSQLYPYDISYNETRTIMYSDLYELMQDKITINDFVSSFEKAYKDYLQNEITAVETIETTETATIKKRQLKLFIMEYQELYMQSSINQFNDNSEDVEFKAEVTRTSRENHREFKNKLTVKLMSGNDPDVIVFEEDYFPSLSKIISNGVFADLNPLISNDTEWDDSLYNKEILKLGEYNGKRYYIPITVRTDMFGTTMQTLANNDIVIDESNWTWHELSKKVIEFSRKNEGEERYFFSPSFDFRKMIKNCGINFVDYEKKQSDFQSVEFIELMKTYKDIMPAIAPEEIEKIALNPDLLKRGSLVFIDNRQLIAPYSISITNSAYKHYLNEEVKMLPYPKYSDSKEFIMHIETGLAINEKCVNKESAYEFIKILLEKSYIQETFSGIPLYNKVYEDKKDKYMNYWPPKGMTSSVCIGNGYHMSDALDAISPSKELFDNFDKLISKIKVSQPLDISVYNIIDEEMKDFLNDKKTVEETAKNIDDKISIYLNE